MQDFEKSNDSLAIHNIVVC